MVITLFILWLATSGIAGVIFLAWSETKKDVQELLGLWSEERDRRIDLEIEVGEARASISRMISANARQWAYDEAARIH